MRYETHSLWSAHSKQEQKLGVHEIRISRGGRNRENSSRSAPNAFVIALQYPSSSRRWNVREASRSLDPRCLRLQAPRPWVASVPRVRSLLAGCRPMIAIKMPLEKWAEESKDFLLSARSSDSSADYGLGKAPV